jgi:prophage tail gpP-like protein
LSSNPAGELVLLGSGGFAWVGNDLVEGVNIRTGHEIIHSIIAANSYMATSQKGGTDQEWGPKTTHQLQSKEQGGQFSPGFMPQQVLSELPSAGVDMLKKRTGMEKDANDMDQIWVTITHLGWLRPSNDSLWVPGQTVTIDAPMLVLRNHPLVLRTVTFSRDNQQGTIATLELSNQAAFSQEAGPDQGSQA